MTLIERLQKGSFCVHGHTKEIVSLLKGITWKLLGQTLLWAQISFLLLLWWTTHMEIQTSCAWFEFKLLLTLVENFDKRGSGFLRFPTTADQYLIYPWIFILSHSFSMWSLWSTWWKTFLFFPRQTKLIQVLCSGAPSSVVLPLELRDDWLQEGEKNRT
jgi:hypothetical protein